MSYKAYSNYNKYLIAIVLFLFIWIFDHEPCTTDNAMQYSVANTLYFYFCSIWFQFALLCLHSWLKNWANYVLEIVTVQATTVEKTPITNQAEDKIWNIIQRNSEMISNVIESLCELIVVTRIWN